MLILQNPLRAAIQLSLILCIGFSSQAQSPAVLKSQFKLEYVGKVLTARNFCEANKLVYAANGELEGKCRPGPWTVYGKFYITQIDIERNKLKISGERVMVGPDPASSRGLVLFRTRDPIYVEVQLSTPPTLETGRKAFYQAFLNPKEDVADFVPDYWKVYLRPTLEPVNPPAGPGSLVPTAAPVSRDAASVVFKAESGVIQGRARKQTRPTYPEVAKAYRQAGTVILKGTINTEGRIESLVIAKPAGFGLDEAAIEAVRQWEYVPYILKGEPVSVETHITVNFVLP